MDNQNKRKIGNNTTKHNRYWTNISGKWIETAHTRLIWVSQGTRKKLKTLRLAHACFGIYLVFFFFFGIEHDNRLRYESRVQHTHSKHPAFKGKKLIRNVILSHYHKTTNLVCCESIWCLFPSFNGFQRPFFYSLKFECFLNGFSCASPSSSSSSFACYHLICTFFFCCCFCYF